MPISVPDPKFQTIIFSGLLFIALVLSVKKNKDKKYFDISTTNELKGLAILMVIFAHIGYFLSKDRQFLFPLSILGGVGVNLFLFLSGFGLSISALKSRCSILNFYIKKIRRLFLPLWIVIGIIFLMDRFILNRSYAAEVIVQNFLGWYREADIYQSFNSSLWYFSLALIYSLLFPLLFWKKYPYISPILLLISGYLLLKVNLPVTEGVLKLYKLHFIAFPLGVLFAQISQRSFFIDGIHKIQSLGLIKIITQGVLIFLVIYTAFNSGVGGELNLEHSISLLTMVSLLFIFLIKNFQIRLLNLWGIYSYEIYLFHWPILYRYDILYKHMPAYLATATYLIVFLFLGFLVKKAVRMLY